MRRVGGEHREAVEGLLVNLPVLGLPLVVFAADGRQLMTTAVLTIDVDAGWLRVRTKNSEYRVEPLAIGR